LDHKKGRIFMGVMRSITLIYCGVSFAVGCIYLVLAARRVQSLLHCLFAGVYPDAPVVLISGFTKDHDIRDPQSTGGMTFLPKPFRKSELLTALTVRPGPAPSHQSGRHAERS
jgi:FixJ family two-component response regulator